VPTRCPPFVWRLGSALKLAKLPGTFRSHQFSPDQSDGSIWRRRTGFVELAAHEHAIRRSLGNVVDEKRWLVCPPFSSRRRAGETSRAGPFVVESAGVLISFETRIVQNRSSRNAPPMALTAHNY